MYVLDGFRVEVAGGAMLVRRLCIVVWAHRSSASLTLSGIGVKRVKTFDGALCVDAGLCRSAGCSQRACDMRRCKHTRVCMGLVG